MYIILLEEAEDEYRLKYNQSKVALNWSSLQDLNARTFEALVGSCSSK